MKKLLVLIASMYMVAMAIVACGASGEDVRKAVKEGVDPINQRLEALEKRPTSGPTPTPDCKLPTGQLNVEQLSFCAGGGKVADPKADGAKAPQAEAARSSQPVPPTPTATFVPVPGVEKAPVADANQAPICQTKVYFTEVAKLKAAEAVAVVDRDFVLSAGGQWSEPGFQLPSGNLVVWTDWLAAGVPPGVKPLSASTVQGNWGVWTLKGPMVVPAPNGGGRFLQICQ